MIDRVPLNAPAEIETLIISQSYTLPQVSATISSPNVTPLVATASTENQVIIYLMSNSVEGHNLVS